MKTSQLSTLLLAALIYAGCNSVSEKTENSDNVSTVQEIETESKKEVLKLNEGAKWQVNAEMKPFVLASESAFNSYRTGSNRDYRALATELKKQNDLLISSCTMEGESHDQLHLWLLPHLKLVKDLDRAASDSEADALIEKLDSSFNTYHFYFE